MSRARRSDFFAVGQWYDELHAGDRRRGDRAARAVPAARRAPAADRPELRRRNRCTSRWTSGHRAPVGSAGPDRRPRRAARRPGIVVFAHGQREQPAQPAEPSVARRSTRAGSARCSSTSSPRRRAPTARTSSTSSCSRRRLRGGDAMGPAPSRGHRPARLGYFGASTGAAAALWAAAEPDNAVAAVVSRGGRPDLAGTRCCRAGADAADRRGPRRGRRRLNRAAAR